MEKGKSVRRRAASMETSKYEKRRGRVKKQVESLKNGGIASMLNKNGEINFSQHGIKCDFTFILSNFQICLE